MEKVLSKEEFMELVCKDIQRKKDKEKGAKDAQQHMFDNYDRINNRMRKYKRKYRRYE